MSLASAFIVRLGQMFRDPPRALVRLSIFGGLSLLLILITWKGSTSLSYSWTPPISESELKNISQKAKEYAENPVQAPYKSTFWEVGQRSRELSQWLSKSDKLDPTSKVGRQLQDVTEITAQQLFPFLRNPPRNPGSETSLSDLRHSFDRGSRGIVIPVGGGEQSFRFAGHLIVSLRKVLGCRLPIQIVYAGENDLPKKERDRIAKLTGATDVEFLDIFTIFDDTSLKLKDGGWAIKAFALLGSRFEEVILLDADAVFIQQPERLYAQTAYIEKEALLFHDRLLWQHAFKERHEWWKDQIKEPSAEMNKSLVWTEDYAEECDSGAVVLNKARVSTLVGILHVAWQNTYDVREEVTYRKGHGDKESWWLGLEFGGSSYEFESHYGSMIGWGESKGAFLLKNKGVDPDGYEVPEYWMMDGEWHKGRTKDDMSCMTDTEVLELTDEEKRVLRESIEIAKEVDVALKGATPQTCHFSLSITFQTTSDDTMTVPAFGFSAGDFVSALKLIVDITQALKNTGGAAGDYLQVLADLNLLKDVLSHLHQQQTGATRQRSSNPFAEHARKQADLTLSTLANFLDLISKFDASLGPQRSSAWYRGVGRKAQWALVYSKHVDDLRSRIGTQIQTLNLVTQLQEEYLDLSMTVQLLQNEQVITQLQERRIISIEELREQLSLLDLQDDEHQPGNAPAPPQVIEDSQSSANDRPVVADVEESDINATTTLGDQPSTLPQQDMTSQQEETTQTLLPKLLRAVIRDLHNLIMKAWLLFPGLMRHYSRLCTSMSMPPLLVLAENISFEDVLGRQTTLQYDFFRHWANVDMFLNKQFENCPGQQYIAKKQYFFLGADAATNKLNSNVEIAWQAMARPGCQISMSIKMIAEQKDVSEAKCPSPGCKGRSVKIDDEETFSCQKCDLTYSMLPKNPAKEQSIKERRKSPHIGTCDGRTIDSEHYVPREESIEIEEGQTQKGHLGLDMLRLWKWWHENNGG
ncbi:mannosyltransferase putative-domain-containing protein [Fusarium oxysporum Fo47]|uniref:mannosyltransferase putative-domain-containing protein n=1 Tax=Fusarium oxysporum Fo47 TaxID=660027 RepID=UPI0028699B28|nr:mannosyltransferase putative-domain-containing protein [Fusarium oxysporum Fo47]WJG37314.1 mannosyltransferase putative-domain-containing protein [Fusarium oxysporum Fo47]